MHHIGSTPTQRWASDEDLVRAAQDGDAIGLGVLLERHRPQMHATALQMLHDPARAHDAVHDAFLVALRDLGRLRDGGAVGGWLHAIVRNRCLSELRQTRRELPEEAGDAAVDRLALAASEEAIDRLALRDWVWSALARLSEPLRLTAMLRYFGAYPSYEEIAAICGVPVGTVRSRLNQVKVKLAEALLEAAELAHDDARRVAEAQQARFLAATDEINRGAGYSLFIEDTAPDIVAGFSDGTEVRGRDAIRRSLEGDLLAGTKLHLTAVYASVGVTVIEGRFENPADDPLRCPPAMSQVRLGRDGTTERIRLYYAPRTDGITAADQPSTQPTEGSSDARQPE